MGVLLRFEHPPPWGELCRALWAAGRLPPISAKLQDRDALTSARSNIANSRALIECPGCRHASAVEAPLYARSERYPTPPKVPTSWRRLGFDAEAVSNAVCGAGRVALGLGHSWGAR
jgi:hypothetical protein